VIEHSDKKLRTDTIVLPQNPAWAIVFLCYCSGFSLLIKVRTTVSPGYWPVSR
jgi:hypothetical protein